MLIRLYFCSGTSSGISLCSFFVVISAPVNIASASISLAFLVGYGILEMFLKAMGKKRTKHLGVVLLASSKPNIIKKIIFKALADAEISHEEFTLVSNEVENYGRLKENVRFKNIR